MAVVQNPKINGWCKLLNYGIKDNPPYLTLCVRMPLIFVYDEGGK